MATSHYCNGKWREGPVSACNKHKKLSSKQATVHRGAGTPGGFKGDKATPSDSGSSSSSSSTGSSSGSSSSGSSSSGSSSSGSSSSGSGKS